MAKKIIRGVLGSGGVAGCQMTERYLMVVSGEVKRPVILLTGQMSIMVAGKRVDVPPLFLSVQEEEEEEQRRRLSRITQAC